MNGDFMAFADASRIAACVNACRNISTEDLEKTARGEVAILLAKAAEQPNIVTVQLPDPDEIIGDKTMVLMRLYNASNEILEPYRFVRIAQKDGDILGYEIPGIATIGACGVMLSLAKPGRRAWVAVDGPAIVKTNANQWGVGRAGYNPRCAFERGI